MDTPKVFGEEQWPALVWHGDDPVVFSCVQAALNDEGIPSFQVSDHKNLMRGAVPRPGYDIFVRTEDAARAEQVIRQAINSSELPEPTKGE